VTDLKVRTLESIAQVDARRWNALLGEPGMPVCLPGSTPFLRHEFLLALEQSGCATARTGWAARHLTLEDRAGTLKAAMPLYLKSHSRGEFVFDFSWANAYLQHGLRYYPKLLSAVPFTPVTGPRLLVDPRVAAPERAALERALVAAAMSYARSQRLSSWHVLFPAEENRAALQEGALIERRDCQFHWHNRGYDSFESFLASFTAEKRKKAKRERRRVAEAGIEFETRFAGEMDEPLWQSVYEFYADTFYRHGHEPYLNLRFFKLIAASMPERLMLKIARLGASPIAVAIFFVGDEALYGRYWGAAGHYHSLHFETCYYQGIDFCIERGLARFEPGTQGEHKVPRGFVPVITTSAHDVIDPRFAAAIRDYAAREARGVDDYAAAVNEHVPYHRPSDEELRL
jgi:predicted N-acyltransferase